MASVNKVIVVGDLGKDPETRFLPDGKAVCNFSSQPPTPGKTRSAKKKETTEWHRVSSFGRLAEICGEYLKKGSQVYIEGKLRTRKWQDKEGQDRYTTEIIAEPPDAECWARGAAWAPASRAKCAKRPPRANPGRRRNPPASFRTWTTTFRSEAVPDDGVERLAP